MTPRRSTRKRKVDSGDDAQGEDDPEKAVAGENESESKPKAPSVPLLPLTKPKRKRKKVFVVNEEEEAQPTYTRKTEKGGYTHTNLSKKKISEANTGNKPWNFGKHRSSADRAKIAAGVRARNRTILLQKLKRLGITEEEYLIKKKEIKYLRERIRRAKLANGKHRDKKLEKKLQDAIDATSEKKIDKVNAGLQKAESQKAEKKPEEKKKEDVAVKVEGKSKPTSRIFSKEITWRPFGSSESNDFAYDQSCPEGGPGGLICCDACSNKYNMFLIRTSEDVEKHRIIKESGEVTEILDFLGQKKDVLKKAVNTAKTKVPPLPPAGSGRLALRPAPDALSNRKSGIASKSEKPEINSDAWNLTSVIDIGVIGGVESV